MCHMSCNQLHNWPLPFTKQHLYVAKHRSRHTEARSLTVLLPHPLTIALGNLSPNTSVIARSVSALPSSSTCSGFQLEVCLNGSHPSSAEWQSDTPACQRRRAPHQLEWVYPKLTPKSGRVVGDLRLGLMLREQVRRVH